MEWVDKPLEIVYIDVKEVGITAWLVHDFVPVLCLLFPDDM